MPKESVYQNDRKYSLGFFVNHKFGQGHTNRSGFILNRLAYDVNLRQSPADGQPMLTFADETGHSHLLQFYSQSRFDLNKFTLNTGIHSQVFALNGEAALEPRAGLNWRFRTGQSLSLAYGLHSRLEPVGFYLAQQTNGQGTTQPNRDLGFTRSHHFVLGYEWTMGTFSRLRIEPFYQRLFDVPVTPFSSFSMINLDIDWFFNDSLVNRGTGTNTGIDFTLEKFLHKGYYYLITLSLFDSKYKGDDGIERNTRYNKNYVANFLLGKEWKTGASGNNILGINLRFSLLGGDRISPVDNAASQAAKDVVYDETNAFADSKPAVYYLDFTASWQRNKPGYSSTWSFQFVNMLFQKEFFGYRYNLKTDTVEPLKETVVIPSISYRIDF
jgi:hypothetical protein